MPHDSKGRLIEMGDYVKGPRWDAQAEGYRPVIGRAARVWPGAESCNVELVVAIPDGEGQFAGETGRATVTASEVELVLKADGSEPTPAC